jgi:hypothetical protein
VNRHHLTAAVPDRRCRETTRSPPLEVGHASASCGTMITRRPRRGISQVSAAIGRG